MGRACLILFKACLWIARACSGYGVAIDNFYFYILWKSCIKSLGIHCKNSSPCLWYYSEFSLSPAWDTVLHHCLINHGEAEGKVNLDWYKSVPRAVLSLRYSYEHGWLWISSDVCHHKRLEILRTSEPCCSAFSVGFIAFPELHD